MEVDQNKTNNKSESEQDTTPLTSSIKSSQNKEIQPAKETHVNGDVVSVELEKISEEKRTADIEEAAGKAEDKTVKTEAASESSDKAGEENSESCESNTKVSEAVNSCENSVEEEGKRINSDSDEDSVNLLEVDGDNTSAPSAVSSLILTTEAVKTSDTVVSAEGGNQGSLDDRCENSEKTIEVEEERKVSPPDQNKRTAGEESNLEQLEQKKKQLASTIIVVEPCAENISAEVKEKNTQDIDSTAHSETTPTESDSGGINLAETPALQNPNTEQDNKVKNKEDPLCDSNLEGAGDKPEEAGASAVTEGPSQPEDSKLGGIASKFIGQKTEPCNDNSSISVVNSSDKNEKNDDSPIQSSKDGVDVVKPHNNNSELLDKEEEMEILPPSSPPVLMNRQVENVRSSNRRAKMSMSPNKGGMSSEKTEPVKISLRPHTARKTLNPPSDRSLRIRGKRSKQNEENQENMNASQGNEEPLVNGLLEDSSEGPSSEKKKKTLISVDHEVSFNVDTDNEDAVNESLGIPDSSEESPVKRAKVEKGGSRPQSPLVKDVKQTGELDGTKPRRSSRESEVSMSAPTSDKEQQEMDSAKSTPSKGVPKARKSCQPLPAKQSNSEKAKSQASAGIANMTLRLNEIEKSLGIKGKTLADIDAKTLDKLILRKAQERRNSIVKKGGAFTGLKKSIGDHSGVHKSTPQEMLSSEKSQAIPELGISSAGMGKIKKKKRRMQFGRYKLPGAKQKKKKMFPAQLNSDFNSTALLDESSSSQSSQLTATSEDKGPVKLDLKQGVESKPGSADNSWVDIDNSMPRNVPGKMKRRRRRKGNSWFVGKSKTKKKFVQHGQRTLDQMFQNKNAASSDLKAAASTVIQSALSSENLPNKQEYPSLDEVKDSEDASSVVSSATSNTDSEVPQVKKRSRPGEEEEEDRPTPSLSPVCSPSKVGPGYEHLPPPVISPQKPFPPPRSSHPQSKSKLDSMVYTHPLHGNPSLLKHQIELAQGQEPSVADTPMEDNGQLTGPISEAGGQQAIKYINTPNGISYPVTPPKTPETAGLQGANKSPVAKERDFIPLCLCKINGTSFTKMSGVVYCQALDSIDGKVIGCCNKVNNAQLVRPAVKIPFMAVCEAHRKRLRNHQCCPGCGHFCTQGKFYQCKKDGSAIHYFHRQCQVFKDNKYFCPHCGEESLQIEVIIKSDAPRQSFFIKEEAINKSKAKSSGPKARMSFGGSIQSDVTEMKPENDEDSGVSLSLQDGKKISSVGLPFGPLRGDLESIIAMLNLEKPKKLRAGPKNIYHASKTNDLEKLVVLLGEGVDPNHRFEDHNNKTALHAAAAGGNLIHVHVLLQAGASAHALDNSLRTPLMEAAESGHLEIIKYLMKAGATADVRAEDGMTTLHLAAKSGSIETIEYILDIKDIDVNIKDDGGWTPIIWASEHRHLHIVKFLLAAGADPNMRDNEENTALHWAAYAGSVDIAELFLNAGSDLEAANEHGDRALHIAARQDHYQCVVLFLARGADSEARNNENEAPISCCIEQSSQTWMALRVNRQLRGIANRQFKRPERLLHRDISMGKESNPMPVVNDIDDENYPQDFVYVTENVETSPMNINRCITSLQYCRCKDDCSSMFCVCGRNSVRCWYDKEGRLVKDFNMMEPPLVFECNKACRCWSNCQNRVVQLGITCRLQVFRTPGRGWGCRTLLDIPQGTFICEYIGEHISDAEADSREDDSYLFDLDNKDTDTFCIDARKYGNVSRFINHLCEPNLIPVKVFVEHQDLRFPRICFFASRDIKANEELGFDYGEKFWIIKWKQFTCACASPKCKYSSETIHKTIEDYNKRQMEEEENCE